MFISLTLKSSLLCICSIKDTSYCVSLKVASIVGGILTMLTSNITSALNPVKSTILYVFLNIPV